ncbi:MAG: hypothetical protein RL376_491 [Verrucomicrobiota bacterium]|jgi:dolichol-phosphate mannosyltransferase
MLLSVVVPVFKEQEAVPRFLGRVLPVLSALTAEFEVIFCLDPSPDDTEAVILAARARDARVKLLRFSRRVGQPMATLAGLRQAGGEAVVVMDVDLQDPPELIPAMVAAWREEGCDAVLAQRRSRAGEPWLRRVVARCAYGLMRRIGEVPIPENTGDFRLLSRRAVDAVNALEERHGFLRGMVALVGYRQKLLPFDRPARETGESNYPVIGSLRIGFNGLFCFSHAPLQVSWWAGLAAGAAGGLVLAGGVLASLGGVAVAWGWVVVSALVLFLAGVQLVVAAVLGEYIGRIYDEVRRRPRYLVARSEGFEGAAGS